MQVIIINETTQEFNGLRYWARVSKYYSRSTRRGGARRLHRDVWEYHNGPIPKGYHVHHKDTDRKNNQPDNLELRPASKHLSHHGKQGDHANWVAAQQRGAALWHGSEEGKEWHKEQYEKHCKAVLHKKVEHTCVVCGEKFMAQAGAKTCSRRCRAKLERGRDSYRVEKTCATCGEKFMAPRFSRQKNCSRECGIVAAKDKRLHGPNGKFIKKG